jgi:glyoxylase-like metal-dependent hydrolase (beta-lactamase superfamily II)
VLRNYILIDTPHYFGNLVEITGYNLMDHHAIKGGIMAVKLLTRAVGPWPMNTYAVVCEETQTSAIIDPGEDAEDILTMVKGTQVDKILLTHGHGDHVGALETVKKATGAPVYLHPADGEKFEVAYDISLEGTKVIEIGNQRLGAIHTPGHTPGQTCFDLGDQRIIVGDTLFVNGPGHTVSPEDFTTTMAMIQKTIFAWPGETTFYPGHGPSGKIGDERPAIEAFIQQGWPADLHGDVTWK